MNAEGGSNVEHRESFPLQIFAFPREIYYNTNMTDGMLGAPLEKTKVKQMNPLVLAFVGDGVETLRVRTRLALSSDAKANALHRLASGEVNAHAQSEQAERILPFLTEEEAEIYHRARNSKSRHHAKNFSVVDYRRASGLEAVIGYLYLTGESERLEELFAKMETV